MDSIEMEKGNKARKHPIFSLRELMKELARISLSSSIYYRFGHCERGRRIVN